MNIIELAKQAGWDAHHAEFDPRIQAFAALVAAQERDECARIAKAWDENKLCNYGGFIAVQIRARGTT